MDGHCLNKFMETLKRIEIITLSITAESLCRKLDKAGAPGYTVLPDVQGSGKRGKRMSDELTGVSQNCMIIVACPEAQLEAILRVVRPVIKNYGGLCMVSDVQSL